MRQYYSAILESFTGAYPETADVQVLPYWVVAQSRNEAVRVNPSGIQYSTDAGTTWGSEIAFNTTQIRTGFVFGNGKFILVGYRNVYYGDCYSTQAPQDVVVLDENDNPYTLHTPANPLYPGNYFVPFEWDRPMILPSGNEIVIWGNYCNNGIQNQGASPVFVWMAKPDGTVKIAYQFGQHPGFSDTGTAQPTTGGTLLGDPLNSNITRHVHSCGYGVERNLFVAQTGDADADRVWLHGDYNEGTDTWTWDVIPRFQIGTEGADNHVTGVSVYGNYILACMDVDAVNDISGIYALPIDTITQPATHVKLMDFPDDGKEYSTGGCVHDPEWGVMVGQQRHNTIFNQNPVNIIGDTTGFNNYHFTETAYRLSHGHFRNRDGYFRFNTDFMNPLQGSTYMVRPGKDLVTPLNTFNWL